MDPEISLIISKVLSLDPLSTKSKSMFGFFSAKLIMYFLWFDKATPEKGGEGALFVYLKKIKE